MEERSLCLAAYAGLDGACTTCRDEGNGAGQLGIAVSFAGRLWACLAEGRSGVYCCC